MGSNDVDTLINIGRIVGTNLDDTYTVEQDTALSVTISEGVLLNDTDADNDPLTAALDTSPSNGVLAFNLDGSFVYTPTNSFTGTDTFTYHANDGTDNSNGATVTIDVTTVALKLIYLPVVLK